MATTQSTQKGGPISPGGVEASQSPGKGLRPQRPGTLRQRKSSYFRSWERYITSTDGVKQSLPKTPVKSALIQQDTVRIVRDLSTIKEEQCLSASKPDKTEHLRDHAKGFRLCSIVLSLALAVFLGALVSLVWSQDCSARCARVLIHLVYQSG